MESGDSDPGVSACMQVPVAEARIVDVLPECAVGSSTVSEPWALVVEWRVTNGLGSAVVPAVGPLRDTTSDGVTEGRDLPVVVIATDRAMLAIDGSDGATLFSQPYQASGVAVADLDQDGLPEVLVLNGDTVAAWSATGELVWESAAIGDALSHAQLTVADLEGSGKMEIVADRAILDARTGSITATLGETSVRWRGPVVADLDGDGAAEIILGDGVFDRRGALLWRGPLAERGVFAAIVNADEDPQGEVIFVGEDPARYALVDDSGETLAGADLPGSDPGPPCVADFDGDGAPEVAVAANSALSMLELDGTIVWSVPMGDPSGLAGCSAADLDLDGAAEVLHADEEDFRIFAGRTGEVLVTYAQHRSGTLFEYPVVADVDLDGAAEIVLVDNGGENGRGVTVLGHRDGGWPRVGSSWPVHDFAPGRLNADGSAPTPAGAPWLSHNMFRAVPTSAREAASELRVAITEVCATACEEGGEIVVAWQVANYGSVASAPDEVMLFAVDDQGHTWDLSTAEIPSLAPGESPPGSTFTIDALAARGARLGLGLRDGGSCYPEPHRFLGDVVCP